MMEGGRISFWFKATSCLSQVLLLICCNDPSNYILVQLVHCERLRIITIRIQIPLTEWVACPDGKDGPHMFHGCVFDIIRMSYTAGPYLGRARAGIARSDSKKWGQCPLYKKGRIYVKLMDNHKSAEEIIALWYMFLTFVSHSPSPFPPCCRPVAAGGMRGHCPLNVKNYWDIIAPSRKMTTYMIFIFPLSIILV